MIAAEQTMTGIRTMPVSNIILMLLLGAWFFLVFPTEPLYFENQNTKFLHGMALAGIGHLDRDWTANTIDVMPVFTGIVYILHVATPAFFCYLVQIALFAVFLFAFVEIARFAVGRPVDHPAIDISTLSIPTFSVIVGSLMVAGQFSNGGARVFGGVAKQYLLGPALEPQSFGVLFLLAVIVFLRHRTEAALWLAAIPAIIHPGYVVPAGTLILAFLLAAWLSPDRARRPRWIVAIFSLTAAGASMVYLGLMILPTSAESWQSANEILAKIRIPRHAVPAHWFDVDAGAKIVGCTLALWLVRRRAPDLFWVIAFCFATALGLTLLSAVLDSNELGMISPWRISVYLVPIALAVLIGQFVAVAIDNARRGRAPTVYKALGAGLVILVIGATAHGVVEKAKHYRPEAPAAHIAFMRETGGDGTLYLTDPHNMDIRLQSGLPQLVSWKSHPYKDLEVLEWYRRYLLAKDVFTGKIIDCGTLTEAVKTYGTTHLLLESPNKVMDCADATSVFENEKARIYRLGF